MASSIASYIILNKDLATGRDVATEVPLENYEIHTPKQTSIDKIGGILCCVCDLTFGNKKDFDSHYGAHNAGLIVYTCVACKKQHSGYPSFRNHCYLQHIVKNKFVCQQCNKSFSKQTALTAHITAIHDFKCGECDEQFRSKKELQIHKIIHKKVREDPPYDCTKCSEIIKSIDMCESHIDAHCEIQHPCPICAIVLPNKQEATLHLTEHFNEKVTPEITKFTNSREDSSIDTLGGILCGHCDLLFKNRVEIDSHFDSEHEDKVIVYSCNICEKQYTKYSLFGDHCYFHISRDKFQCDQCSRLFPRLPLLVMHNLAFHSEGAVDKPFRCDKCIYGFKSHYRLLAHKRLVHDEVSIKCQIPECSATFSTPLELTKHQRLHKSCLDNWCRQCGLQFATLRACARHLDAHRRKLYTCPVCARPYRERYLVLKHLPNHFESVLHICKVCGRSYTARSRLIQHTKTHNEAKKFKCAYCDKTFLRPHELAQHERVHTGDKPYHCPVCSKAFASYPNWSKHLTRAHAFDKNKIKEARETRKRNADKSSPIKPESGIESAGSEVSDLYGFVESDSDEPYAPIKKIKKESEVEAKIDNEGVGDSRVPSRSIKDSVSAAIDRIGDDLDLMTSPVEMHEEIDLNDPTATDFATDFDEVDDSSDIKAIVEHIDALSGGLEIESPSQVPASGMMQYEMIPAEDDAYNPVYTQMTEPQFYQPTSVPLEYGPDFNTYGTEVYTQVINLNDPVLPHIDPLLTIKAEQNAKIFVQNVQNIQNNLYESDANTVVYDQNWQPILSKVFSYEEANDNRMYVLNGNMF